MLQVPNSNDSSDAMSLLGTFLLQGWVMTDELCSEEGCPVPIMRSKDGAIKFCVNHDPLPTSNSRNTKKIPSAPAPATPEAEGDDGAIEQPSSTTSDSDEFRLQQERREQSSKASQLIGQRMLQRWVLLNETCPNEACFAIPLVRHPSNKTMYCVICEQSYQPETDSSTHPEETRPSSTASSTVAAPAPVQPAATAPSLQQQQQQQKEEEPVHSPLDSPAVDRSIKRQKKTESILLGTSSLQTSREATTSAVQCLSAKMADLTATLPHTSDAKELVLLCKSLEACANALNACVTAMNTCHSHSQSA